MPGTNAHRPGYALGAVSKPSLGMAASNMMVLRFRPEWHFPFQHPTNVYCERQQMTPQVFGPVIHPLSSG